MSDTASKLRKLAASCRVLGIAEDAKTMDAAADEIDRLRSREAIYVEYARAADRVFQQDANNPHPLLPDFLPLGASKAFGVVKLAEAYIGMRAELDYWRNGGTK